MEIYKSDPNHVMTQDYSHTPGEEAHELWESFVPGGGLFLISGTSTSGKSTFAERIASEASEYAAQKGKSDILYLEIDKNERSGDDVLTFDVFVPPITSIGEPTILEKSVKVWIENILEEVEKSSPRIIVLDEVTDYATARLTIELFYRGYAVFAVFHAVNVQDTVKRFHEMLLGERQIRSATIEPIIVAFHKIYLRKGFDGVEQRVGMVTYEKETLVIPS